VRDAVVSEVGPSPHGRAERVRSGCGESVAGLDEADAAPPGTAKRRHLEGAAAWETVTPKPRPKPRLRL